MGQVPIVTKFTASAHVVQKLTSDDQIQETKSSKRGSPAGLEAALAPLIGWKISPKGANIISSKLIYSLTEEQKNISEFKFSCPLVILTLAGRSKLGAWDIRMRDGDVWIIFLKGGYCNFYSFMGPVRLDI